MSEEKRLAMLVLLKTDQPVSDLPGHENDESLKQVVAQEVNRMAISIAVLLHKTTDTAEPVSYSDAYRILLESNVFGDFAEWLNGAGIETVTRHGGGRMGNAQQATMSIPVLKACVIGYLLDTASCPAVEPPEDPGLLTDKTPTLPMPNEFKEGGFEPLQMYFARFSKQVETLDPGNPDGPSLILEVTPINAVFTLFSRCFTLFSRCLHAVFTLSSRCLHAVFTLTR